MFIINITSSNLCWTSRNFTFLGVAGQVGVGHGAEADHGGGAWGG